MPKRKCSMNDNIRTEFPFVEGEGENAKCTICKTTIYIGHGGRSDVVNHVKTKKHKLNVQSRSSKCNISNYLSVKSVSDMERQLAAQEATFAYHTSMHNHSFKSMDCTTAIVKKLFNQKFSCSQTKCKSIVTNVIAPFAMQQVMKELKEAQFITIMIDSSNHLDVKLVPLLVRYYNPQKGVMVKVLELMNLSGETSDLLVSYVLQVLKKFELNEKVIAISADNTNTNFGGKKRKGKNNLYHKLKENIENNLIGIGCPAHVVHNAVQAGADCLPIDCQLIVNKIFQHFHIYSVRVESLKSFCDFTATEYKTVLGHTKTRWLSLLPAVQRIIDIFPALKSYFLSIDKCPVILKNFFENALSLTILHFLASQLKVFSSTIKIIEKEDITITEVTNEITKLLNKINCRKSEKYLTTTVKDQLNQLETEGEITFEQFNIYANDFYDTTMEYIEEWCLPFLSPLQSMDWINLKNELNWNTIQETFAFIKTIVPGFSIDEDELFDEFSCVQNCWKSKVDPSNEKLNNQSVSAKWNDIFIGCKNENISVKNMAKLVGFCLALPGCNAVVERVFSLINSVWSDERNRLKIDTVKALIIVKTHFNSMPCAEFFTKICKETKILEEIHKSGKYFTNDKSVPEDCSVISVLS